MSSKNADPFNGAPRRSRPFSSLTLWLVAANTLSAFVILAVFTLVLYLGLAKHLKAESHLILHDEVKTVEGLIRSAHTPEELDNEINPSQTSEEYVKHYVRVMDAGQRVLSETSGMNRVAPHSLFPTPVRDGRPGVDRIWTDPKGEPMMGTAAWIDTGKGELRLVEVALDISNMDNIRSRFLQMALWALFLGFPGLIAVSLAIARRGTKPLREMTEAVRHISVSNLNERIRGEDWPEEVSSLAHAMNSMLGRLHDSFERLYNSAVNLSHKMRTPLTILKGEAEVALARDRTSDELREVVASSLEENGRLMRLVDNILFLANAEIGKLVIDRKEVEVSEHIDNLVDYYLPLAEDKGIELSLEGEARMSVDAPLFRKAVAVLISNAVTYSTSGGAVRIVVGAAQDGAGEVRVIDSGAGIPKAEQDKIFDRFYRVYTTRFMDPHGTGLGLPIAKAIMDLHQGEIRLCSEPEKGTTVTLRFPPAPAGSG